MKCRFNVFPLLALVAVAFVGTGCDGVDGVGEDPAAPLSTPYGTMRPAGSNVPVDPAINLEDTYVTADVTMEHTGTVTSDVPLYDVATGQMTTTMDVSRPAENFRTEAGYDVSGQVVFNQYALDPMGNPLTDLVDETRTISIHNGGFQSYDAQGTLLDVTGQNDMPSLSDVVGGPEAVASLQITDGIVLDSPPQAFQAQVQPVPGGRFRLATNAVASAGAAQSKETRTYKKQDGKYVLEEVTLEHESSDGRGKSKGRMVVRFRNVKWKLNKEKDEKRREKHGQAGNAGQIGATRFELSYCQANPSAEGCEDYDAGGGSGGGPVPSTCPTTVTGANVVFQHGINSDATT